MEVPGISERVLKKWRKEALQFREDIKTMLPKGDKTIDSTDELIERILRLTQVLLDQHLLTKGR